MFDINDNLILRININPCKEPYAGILPRCGFINHDGSHGIDNATSNEFKYFFKFENLSEEQGRYVHGSH